MSDFVLYPGIAAIAALCFVVYQRGQVMAHDPGNDRMQQIARLIQEGSTAYLRRQYLYVAGFVFAIAGIIALTPLGSKTALAFVLGALASSVAGFVGMNIATRANSRTTQAAVVGGKQGVANALKVAISGGSVMGMGVVGIALLGLCGVLLIDSSPEVVNGYAMGASLVALFARSGGGIFTKGADMGADLVGKVEAGIPEDDPRNPASIADSVGDNVGDVAGLGADLLESYVESIIATMAIAAYVGLAVSGDLVGGAAALVEQATEAVTGEASTNTVAAVNLARFPLMVAAAGIIASLCGVIWTKMRSDRDPQAALMSGTYVAAGLTVVATFGIVKWLVPGAGYDLMGGHYTQMGVFWANVVGIASGVSIGFVSEYYTSGHYRPVQRLAEDSQTGAAITITSGLAIGMMSTAAPLVILAGAVLLSSYFAGVYGIALAALGMLATTGMIVSVDSYGPIADNAGGIAEMARLDPEVREITDGLDAVGNTTAAMGKGFAIGSAAFAALGLLSAFMAASNLTSVSLSDPTVMAGLLLGGMLPFLFSSLLFSAVGKCAFEMIEEVRRQFREIPGLMEGTAEPDSTRCVDISTRSAIRGMLLPGGLAVAFPVAAGVLLGPEGLAGMLIGALVTGVMLGIQMANSGGAWDNAKKYIETGHFGGKGSETHKAAVVGDTVGDPMKDTVGPSINILIKLMCVIALVCAPLFSG